MPEFKKSTRKNKKYMVKVDDKWVHFGDTRYEQFFDKVPLKLYSHLNHNDKERQKRYLARAKGIVDKNGNLTWDDKKSSNYWSIRWLWT
jgi:hypothetical protein